MYSISIPEILVCAPFGDVCAADFVHKQSMYPPPHMTCKKHVSSSSYDMHKQSMYVNKSELTRPIESKLMRCVANVLLTCC